MATLVTLLFQGKVEASEPLAASEEREIVHAAFPMSPARDATARADYRAWKMVPLSSGRLLISAVVNRGEQDDYGRPVLRANGCVLAAAELVAGLRDPAAIWEALESLDLEQGFEAFAGRVEASSIHSAPEAFALFRAELERSGPFHARAAAVLCEETADLYLGDAGRALDLLRPALGLLPLERLQRLHLAVGGEDSSSREPILGLAGMAPESWRDGGLLSGLFGRKKEGQSDAAADFETGEAYGIRGDGPQALVQAITDRPWLAGLDGRDRYRVLLEFLDASQAGAERSLFEVVPELDELRQTVRRIEKLSKDLSRWR